MYMLWWWSVNGGRMVMLWRWPVEMRENGHVTEAACLMEGEWSLRKWQV